MVTAALPATVRRRLTGGIPAARIRTVSVPRHDASVTEKLRTLPDITSAVADALDDLGVGAVLGTDIFAPLAPGMRMCAPAVTLRYVPVNGEPSVCRASEVAHSIGDRDLYGVAHPGDAAVMDCGGIREAAVMGGLSALWAIKAGLAGCLVDGAVRDTSTILDAGLPVWSRCRSPRSGRYRVDAVAINDVVSLAGATVRPGDYIVADADGVCVVPFEHVPAVAAACSAGQAAEDAIVDTIKTSADLEELVRHTSSHPVPC